MARNRLGEMGEELAAGYYEELGWQVLERNWATPRGEIDLIVGRLLEDDAGDPMWSLIVVEVKTRGPRAKVAPQASVTWRKRRQIVAMTKRYISVAGLHRVRVQFDVLAIVWGRFPKVTRFAGAFDACARV
ncbi:MAG: YraN family protein [Myxococcota bacterium]